MNSPDPTLELRLALARIEDLKSELKQEHTKHSKMIVRHDELRLENIKLKQEKLAKIPPGKLAECICEEPQEVDVIHVCTTCGGVAR